MCNREGKKSCQPGRSLNFKIALAALCTMGRRWGGESAEDGTDGKGDPAPSGTQATQQEFEWRSGAVGDCIHALEVNETFYDGDSAGGMIFRPY